MRNLILLIMFIFTSVFAFAQNAKTKETEISNAEKFTNVSGTLIKKEFIEIGTIQQCKIEVAIFTDLITQKKASAVRFEYEYRSSYTTSNKIAMLDGDEIEGFIKSMKIIKEKIVTAKADNYTEVTFRSRSNFTAGCFSKNDSWDTFMKLISYDSDSYIFMEKSDLDTLISLLENAKTKMI